MPRVVPEARAKAGVVASNYPRSGFSAAPAARTNSLVTSQKLTGLSSKRSPYGEADWFIQQKVTLVVKLIGLAQHPAGTV